MQDREYLDVIWKKYKSWRGRCGARALHHGKDAKLIRMNKIRTEYWNRYFLIVFGKRIPEV